MDDKDTLARKSEYQKQWVARNKERVSAWRKARRNGPEREKILAQKRESYIKTKDKVLAYQKRYREENPDKILERQKRYRESDPAKLKAAKQRDYRENWTDRRRKADEWKKNNPEWRKKWESKNKDSMREWHRNYSRKRRLDDPAYRAAASMRSRVWALLKKIGQERIISIGLERDKLKEWLEQRFKPGMTWENYGPVWHVDHIVPCSAFDLAKPEELRKCFHYHNMQPLWAKENIVKSGKTLKQPELAFNS